MKAMPFGRRALALVALALLQACSSAPPAAPTLAATVPATWRGTHDAPGNVGSTRVMTDSTRSYSGSAPWNAATLLAAVRLGSRRDPPADNKVSGP